MEMVVELADEHIIGSSVPYAFPSRQVSVLGLYFAS